MTAEESETKLKEALAKLIDVAETNAGKLHFDDVQEAIGVMNEVDPFFFHSLQQDDEFMLENFGEDGLQ